MSVCKICSMDKPQESFCKDKKTKTGYSKICKDCFNAKRREEYNSDQDARQVRLDYKSNHRSENIEYQRKYYQENKEDLLRKRKEKYDAEKLKV